MRLSLAEMTDEQLIQACRLTPAERKKLANRLWSAFAIGFGAIFLVVNLGLLAGRGQGVPPSAWIYGVVLTLCPGALPAGAIAFLLLHQHERRLRERALPLRAELARRYLLTPFAEQFAAEQGLLDAAEAPDRSLLLSGSGLSTGPREFVRVRVWNADSPAPSAVLESGVGKTEFRDDEDPLLSRIAGELTPDEVTRLLALWEEIDRSSLEGEPALEKVETAWELGVLQREPRRVRQAEITRSEARRGRQSALPNRVAGMLRTLAARVQQRPVGDDVLTPGEDGRARKWG